MKIDTVTLCSLTSAWEDLDAARNSTDNGFVADHVDEALRQVVLAMRLIVDGCVVRQKDADEECPECGGMVPNIVACGVPECPRRKGYTDAG